MSHGGYKMSHDGYKSLKISCNIKMSFICEFCNNTFTTKNHLSRHYKTESCVKIQKILKNVNNEHIDKIKIIEEQYKLKLSEQENKIKLLTQENNILKTEIKALEKSSEGYRKIVEKAAIKSTNNIRNKDDTNDKMFQIDINVNNKQLNKTKYKDIPEDVIKKDIQTLKLKDNYQLEYRDNDGYINITHLCKAGGKQFKHWNSIDKTKRFLDVLGSSVGIPTNEIIKYDSGSNR